MNLKALMMSAATAALLAGAAHADSHETDGEMENAAEAAGENAAEAAEDAAQATENAAEDAAQAAEDAAQATENAAEDAAAEAGEEMNEAEAEVEGEAEETGEPQFTSIEEMTVGDVVGMTVYDPEDNRIGDVDYVIDRGNGAEAVIGIGGFLGLGEYTVALPMSEFELQQEPMGFSVDTDKETLEQQPEYDESEIEELPDDTMMSELMSDSSGGAATDAGTEMESGDATGGEMDSSSTTDTGASTDAGASTDTGASTDAATETEMDTDAGDMEAEGETEMNTEAGDTEAEGETETESSN